MGALLVPSPSEGQEVVVRYPLKVVEVDLSMGRVAAPLPFGEVFLLKVPVPEGASEIALDVRTVTIINGRTTTTSTMPAQTHLTRADWGPRSAVVFQVPPLRPKEDYRFALTVSRTESLGVQAGRLKKGEARVTGRTATTFADYVTTDAGLLVASRTRYMGALTSLHFYTVPINVREDFSVGQLFTEPRKALSVFLGITPLELYTEAKVDKLYPVGSPVIGLGLRVYRNARIGAGVMFFEQPDGNPIVESSVDKRDLFFTFGFDVSYGAVLGPIAGLLGAS